jgi:hypothetical protein
MYYKVKLHVDPFAGQLTPEVYRNPSSAHADAQRMYDDGEYSVIPYTLPARLESALSRLWRADANGAAASMSDLFDGYDPELLADEIERSLASMEA